MQNFFRKKKNGMLPDISLSVAIKFHEEEQEFVLLNHGLCPKSIHYFSRAPVEGTAICSVVQNHSGC